MVVTPLDCADLRRRAEKIGRGAFTEGVDDDITKIAAALAQARAEEREACAKVVDERSAAVRETIGAGFGIVLSALEEAAAAIRARSEEGK